MVVDALDLCYTKPHVDTFVIMSGDSDFSPLVAKLRENNKSVIGVGVKNSTSNLLIESCDEFIYYDDLVREVKTRPARRARKQPARAAATETSGHAAPHETSRAAAPSPADAKAQEKRQEAFDLVLQTIEGLSADRGDDSKVWSSHVKQILKRRRPGFNESYYGFKSFQALLEEAAKRGLITLEREGNSGNYTVRAVGD
jgi:chromatin segregation and condensation protein Rec8/ScpA/Scc1 (kleisin family)